MLRGDCSTSWRRPVTRGPPKFSYLWMCQEDIHFSRTPKIAGAMCSSAWTPVPRAVSASNIQDMETQTIRIMHLRAAIRTHRKEERVSLAYLNVIIKAALFMSP
jgi:hypothetical protein